MGHIPVHFPRSQVMAAWLAALGLLTFVGHQATGHIGHMRHERVGERERERERHRERERETERERERERKKERKKEIDRERALHGAMAIKEFWGNQQDILFHSGVDFSLQRAPQCMGACVHKILHAL